MIEKIKEEYFEKYKKRFKSKELIKRMAVIEKQQQEEMKKWWDKVLPIRGSLLRQLVDKQLIIK